MALSGREENELARLRRHEPTIRRHLAEAIKNKSSTQNNIARNLKQMQDRIRELEKKAQQSEAALCKRCRRRPVAQGREFLCDPCFKEVKKEQGK